jgi:GTPase involved in cell partitioning and DNA repair
MPSNKPPPLLSHILEIKAEIKQLRGDISYIKDFIVKYEEKQKKKDLIIVDNETDGDTTQTEASSQGWFW